MESKKQKEIENSLSSELNNMITELELGHLSKESIIGYFTEFLLDAKVDSEIIVNVLERDQFGDLGKEQARYIKVEEGW
jgi:hypothetical protein